LYLLDTFCRRPDSTSRTYRLSRKGEPFEELLRDLLGSRLVITDMRQDQYAGFTGIHFSSILVAVFYELRDARLEILWRHKRGKPPIAIARRAFDGQVRVAADPDIQRAFGRTRLDGHIIEFVERAFVGDVWSCPEFAEHLDAFFHPLRAFVRVNATDETLLWVTAEPHGHDHAPAAAGKVIKGGVGFRHLHGVAAR
jgi:hypothetical protein